MLRLSIILTSTNEIDFTRLWHWWQWPPTINASQRRQIFAIINLDGMFKKSIAILIIHFCMLLVKSKNQ